MSGRLSLVGTPIGNLGDITFRAVETLKEADRIYAEDTRRTRVLLSHLGIEGKRLLSLHAHSTERDIATAIEILQEGLRVVLVTDAGMPSVSDPGSPVVRAAREAGIEVTVIPGPSAVTTAIALSGLVDGGFSFLGFVPRKGKKRREVLHSIATAPHPTVLFESPHRVLDTIVDLREACHDTTRIAVCRELTKRFEEVQVVTLGEAVALPCVTEAQGEFTLVIEGGARAPEEAAKIDVEARARQLLEAGSSVRDASTQIVKELGKNGEKVHKRDIYARVQKTRADEGELTPLETSGGEALDDQT